MPHDQPVFGRVRGVYARHVHFTAPWLSALLSIVFLVAVVASTTSNGGALSSLATKLQVGFGVALVVSVVACFVMQAGPYIVGEVGKLTFARIRRESVALCPATPRAAATVWMLLGDALFCSALLLGHTDTFGDRGVVGWVARVLLLQPPIPSSEGTCAAGFTALYWLAFVVALVAVVFGSCCFVPAVFNAYNSSGVSSRVRLVVTLLLCVANFSCVPVAAKLVSAIPCVETESTGWGANVVTASPAPLQPHHDHQLVMFWCRSEACGSSPHRAYMVVSCMSLVVFGAVWVGTLMTMVHLDDSGDLAHDHAPKVDPLGLSLTMLGRGLLIACGGLQMHFPSLFALASTSQLATFYFLKTAHFSNVFVLRELAVVSSHLQIAALVTSAGIYVGRQQGSEHVALIICSSVFCLLYFGLIARFAFRHVKKFGWHLYDDGTLNMDLNDVVSSVHF